MRKVLINYEAVSFILAPCRLLLFNKVIKSQKARFARIPRLISMRLKALCLGFLVVIIIVQAKVLIIGGTGRVGRSVAASLLSNNIPTRVLVRNLDAAKAIPQLAGAELIVGDVQNADSLVLATENIRYHMHIHN